MLQRLPVLQRLRVASRLAMLKPRRSALQNPVQLMHKAVQMRCIFRYIFRYSSRRRLAATKRKNP